LIIITINIFIIIFNKYIMAAPSVNYKDTLNKMANLEEVSSFIVSQNAALETKRGMLGKTLSNMQIQISKIRDQIDNIKSKGSVANTEMKQLIADADTKQQQSLKNIKTSISAMINMDKLETSIKNLEGDINTLSSAAGTGTNPAAPAFVPGAGAGAGPGAGAGAGAGAGGPSQAGGYTYGKSRNRGNGRRRRTKKSRKNNRNRKGYYTLGNLKRRI
jgi:hypothetical protein